MVAVDGNGLQSGGCSALVEPLWIIDRLRLETSSLAVGGERRTETLWPVLRDADPIFEVSQVGSADLSRRLRLHQCEPILLEAWIEVGMLNEQPCHLLRCSPSFERVGHPIAPMISFIRSVLRRSTAESGPFFRTR